MSNPLPLPFRRLLSQVDSQNRDFVILSIGILAGILVRDHYDLRKHKLTVIQTVLDCEKYLRSDAAIDMNNKIAYMSILETIKSKLLGR